MGTLTGVKTYDLRFPTSSTLSGSDAMNKDPRLSSAYVVITTDADDGLSGSGFVFTVGRGNDVIVAGIDSLSRVLVGRNVEDMSVFRRHPAASIASLIAVICLVVAGALVWAHPWSASASDGTRFTIGDDEMKLYADICRTESCSVSGDAKSQDAAS